LRSSSDCRRTSASENASNFLRLNPAGLLAALLASFSFAFYNIVGHGILSRYDRWRVLLWTLTAASAFWLFVNPPWRIAAVHYTGVQWAFLIRILDDLGARRLLSLFPRTQHLEPTRAIIASCLEPVFSILLAAALLGEMMHSVQTLGIVLVLAAIVIVQASQPRLTQKHPLCRNQLSRDLKIGREALEPGKRNTRACKQNQLLRQIQTVEEPSPAILTQGFLGVCPAKVLQNCARNQSGEQLRGDHRGEARMALRQIEAQLSPALKDYGAAGRSVFFSVKLDRFLA